MKSKSFVGICQSLLLVICMSLLTSCKEKQNIVLICPYELKATIASNENLADTRELLFNSDYSIVIVKDDESEIRPAQHYRPEHTFSDNMHPVSVTFEKPIHISTLAIFDKGQGQYGVVIKRENETEWKVYWFHQNDLSKDINYIYLPPLGKLESIEP